jgi:mannose-1-phosphate guanylyltransferase
MQAILLAAGYGTRLRPYTGLRPKTLFPVTNRPLLHRLLDQLCALSAEPVLVNCHHLAAQVKAALAGRPGVLVQHEAEILGTGGSLRLAIDQMANDPVLVMNGDLFHDIDLERVYHHHLRSGFDVTMAMHDHPRFNTVTVQDDRVQGFDGEAGERLAFTGIQVVDPDAIERIPRQGFFHIIDLYRELVTRGRIGCCRVDGSPWRDIGTPADYLGLHRELLAGRGWLVDPTARMAAGVVLDGWGCVGAGAQVGEGARLCDCVVWDGATVADNTVCTGRILTGEPAIDNCILPQGTGG